MGDEGVVVMVVSGTLNQIWTDSTYVYTATTEEFSVTDIAEESVVAYIRDYGEFTTVWANDTAVFVGTTSGIKYLYKTCISGTIISPEDISLCLMDYVSPYGVTDEEIRYLHGNNDFLMCCTVSGVDVYKLEPNGYRSSAYVEGVQKCFMTSTGKFYYTLSGINWSINRVDRPQIDWVTPDEVYTTGSGIFDEGLVINDIFVTEQNDNVIFTATSSGVYVIDEATLNYNKYYTE